MISKALHATTSCLPLAALLAGLSAPLAPAALAQSAAGEGELILYDIVVTARKKEENLQSVPVAVSALGQQQLEAAGINSFDQMILTIPNASMSGGIGGTLQGQIGIRGISTLVRIIGIETGVGFYVDGVYMGRPENFNQELMDIERVEVLRGPQGSLFGKNTIAGAINIVTVQPTEELEGRVEAEYGKYDLVRLRGYVSGPLTDSLFGKISASYVNRDGFVKHIGGGEDLDTLDVASFRGQLRFAPNPDVDITLSADGLIDRGRPAFFETTDSPFFPNDPSQHTPYTTNHDQPNGLDRDIWGTSLAANFALGEGELTSITAYRDSSYDAALDDDKLPVRIFVDFWSDDVRSFSQELRYAGMIGDRLSYMAGLYYFDQKAESYRPFGLGDFLTGVPGFEPPITQESVVKSKSYAAFANIDYSVTDRLLLTLGGRFTHEKKNAVYEQSDPIAGLFPNITFVGSTSDDDFSPTVSLSYDVTDEVMVYARFSRGFKSAGFNTDFAPSEEGLIVEPEKATSYEGGLKSQFLNNRVRLNLAGFYTDYKDLQVSQIVGGGVLLQNAATATIKGFEAEGIAFLTQNIQLDGSVGYLDAKYDSFPNCPVPDSALPGTTRNDCADNRIVLAPKWTYALGVQFTYPVGDIGDLFLRGDLHGQSKVYFEPQNTERLSGDSRTVINLRGGLQTEHWDLIAWVENLTKELYVNFSDDRGVIGVPRTVSYGAPRTFGVTARYRF